MTAIVLASASKARAAVLQAAGVPFTVRPASVDERALEAPLLAAGATPGEIANALADAKALAVSQTLPDALVIGADQVLELDGQRWTKPATVAEARAQLRRLAGRSHTLPSAVAVAQNGEVRWGYLGVPRLVMRAISDGEIDMYLAAAGPAVLGSVGAYQIEGPGIQLFEAIEGDYFAVLGLPLLPLLAQLRALGALGMGGA